VAAGILKEPSLIHRVVLLPISSYNTRTGTALCQPNDSYVTQGIFNLIHIGRLIWPYHTLQMHRLDARTNYPASQIPANHVDEIAIATLYLLVMMLMAVLIRLTFRLYMLRSLHWDDGVVVLSSVCYFWLYSVLFLLMSNEYGLRSRGKQVFGIAQSCTIFAGTQHGLGKQQTDLAADEISAIEKVKHTFILYFLH
jgi:hypothetical protein